ncbi:MAG: response regulator [Planctomycetes bacterium]|nr:response regulator [Planctomycetota bacterium]
MQRDPQRLRVLILEDNRDDYELILASLNDAGLAIDPVVVDDETRFVEELAQPYDVVLSDFSMPTFSAMRALDLIRERGLDVPFIVVSGSISEEVAVECMKRGAADYLLKDRLARLGPAVEHAVRERRLRAEKRAAEAALVLKQEELRQSQKLEAIGRLAGGVAHDFNNVLTAIVGYCDLLESSLDSSDPRRRFVEDMRHAGQSAASMTSQLLALSRKQVMHPTIVDLNRIVVDLSGMLRRLLGEDVDLVTVQHDPTAPIEADRGQIEQVLLNLVVNARDAMPRGGRITIETRVVPLEGDRREVTMLVQDTGIGMDESTRARVFEPFFTTKPIGKGTGLGLSTVYGIVAQTGGTITVESVPGRGSCFTLRLPASAAPLTAPAPARRHERPMPTGVQRTILVVEDEEVVRRVVLRLLRGAGYHVLEADGAREAKRQVDLFSGSIDLLLTDIVMPDMTGTELALELRAGHPNLRVIVMSGYVEDVAMHHDALAAGARFLNKPFSRDELLDVIRSELGERGVESS